jgi:hypothetical protein
MADTIEDRVTTLQKILLRLPDDLDASVDVKLERIAELELRIHARFAEMGRQARRTPAAAPAEALDDCAGEARGRLQADRLAGPDPAKMFRRSPRRMCA